jgi:predicted alpha/beta-fold hydrolase
MRGRRALVVLLFLSGGCALKPLPHPDPQPCAITHPTDVWSCIGLPDDRHRESGVTSTSRVATDFRLRQANQHSATSCDLKSRAGFEHIDLQVEGHERLSAFFHEGSPGMPIIFVIHGMFDSNANQYVMVTANALARDEEGKSFGVVVPDMRWHGCLLNKTTLATLGIEEGEDLRAWGRLMQQRYGRPLGLIGFSLGGLDVIHALAADKTGVFASGGIAVSPPADLQSMIALLDEPPSFFRHPLVYPFRRTFRDFLHTRLRELGVDEDQRPFDSYLRYLVAHPPSNRIPTDVDQLVSAGETSTRLIDVRVPLLIITSASDPILGDAPVKALLAAIKSPSVKVIETRDGGHIGQLERYRQWMSDTFHRFFTFPTGS